MAVWQLEPSPDPLLGEVLPCFGTQLQKDVESPEVLLHAASDHVTSPFPDYSLSPGAEEHSVLIF